MCVCEREGGVCVCEREREGGVCERGGSARDKQTEGDRDDEVNMLELILYNNNKSGCILHMKI